MKKMYVYIGVVILLLVLIFLFFKKENKNIKGDIQESQPISLCYQYVKKTDRGFEDKISLMLAISGEKVAGEFKSLPAEKDSKIGTFSGTVEPLDQKTMSRTATVWLDAMQEGQKSREEFLINFGDGSASVAYGEMTDRGDGVYVYKDKTKLTYSPTLSQIECQNDRTIQKIDGNYFAPILTFHNVTDSTKKDRYGLTINTKVFEEKLKSLVDNNYKMVFASEMASYLEKGEKAPSDMVVLTFDDGKLNFYQNVFPLLKKYNVKASLYIITGVRSPNYLNEEQIKEIDKSGLVEIGSHTVYHQYLAKMSEPDQLKELANSKKYLDKLLGKNIDIVAYPYGSFTDRTKELAKQAGYKYGLGFNKIPLRDTSDLFEIDRLGVGPEMNIVKYLKKLNAK